MIELTTEQEVILSAVREIAQKKLKPRAAEIDESAEFPWDTVKIFSENGIMAPFLPEKYGGIGMEYLIFQ